MPNTTEPTIDEPVGPDSFGGEDYPSDPAVEAQMIEDRRRIEYQRIRIGEGGGSSPLGEAIGPAPAADVDALEAELESGDIDDRLCMALKDLLPELLAPHLARLDRRSRDRAHAGLAEAQLAYTQAGEMFEEAAQAIDDLGERMVAVEEACGLRPSLLTTAEAAVARLDEMAQDGTLSAAEIRTIHRTLRAAVTQERAKRS